MTDATTFILLAIAILIAYLTPTIIAVLTHNKVKPVFAINLLLGWTGFGWFMALGMALVNHDKVREMQLRRDAKIIAKLEKEAH